MVVRCCVPFCPNKCVKDGKFSFHVFPTSERRKWLWLHAMKRDKGSEYYLNRRKQEFHIKSTSKVCSAHFTKSDFLDNAKKKFLIRAAVPSIFKWTSDSCSFTDTVDTIDSDEELLKESIDVSTAMGVKKKITSSKRDKKIKEKRYVPYDCSPPADEDNDSEIEEIIIERQIDEENSKTNNLDISNEKNKGIALNEDTIRIEEIKIMDSFGIKNEIDYERELDEDMETENATKLFEMNSEIKQEFLDIPTDADNNYVAQTNYGTDFGPNGNDVKDTNYINYDPYCSDVNNGLHAMGSDVTEDTDTAASLLCKALIGAPKTPKLVKNSLDKIKTEPREIKKKFTFNRIKQKIQIVKISKEAVKEEPTATQLNDSLQKIKKHIIQKNQVFSKRNFKYKYDSLKPSASPISSINLPIFTIEKFRNHNRSINYYTGLKSYDMFHLIFTYVLPSGNADHVYAHTRNALIVRNYNLSGMNQFFLTLMKLKRNFDFNMISDLFCVTEKVVQSIFKAWIQYLYTQLSTLIQWPHREILLKNELHRNAIGGLYIIRLTTENVSKKGLIMLDPDLNLVFVSSLFSESLTAKQLMQQSFFLREVTRKFQLGELLGSDVIITGDKLFDVKSFVKWKESDEIDIVVVDINNKTKDLIMLTEERVNVKQVHEKINTYDILNDYDSSLYVNDQFNEIYAVCCSLCFFQHS